MNPFRVDQTYVVSVRALHEITAEISHAGHGRWWIDDTSEHEVVLAFSPEEAPTVNFLKYRFPVIGYLPFPQLDGVIVALYPAIRQQLGCGLFHEFQDGLVSDDVVDWETFWTPIWKQLQKRYSGGPSSCLGTDSSIDSSSSSASLKRT